MFKITLGVLLGLALVGTSIFTGSGRSAQASDEYCFDQRVTIYATGPITKGTSKADVILVDGKDTMKVYGQGGNDLICSYNFSAEVFGGAGNDHIYGVGILRGEAGNDELIGDESFDVEWCIIELYGGSGNDYIHGEDIDYVDGGSGDDIIDVAGVEETHGGSGNDEVDVWYGGGVFGDSGDDDLDVDYADYVDCGPGRDWFTSYDGFVDQVRRCESTYAPV